MCNSLSCVPSHKKTRTRTGMHAMPASLLSDHKAGGGKQHKAELSKRRKPEMSKQHKAGSSKQQEAANSEQRSKQ